MTNQGDSEPRPEEITKTVIGEPVIRPDGAIVTIYALSDGRVEQQVDHVSSRFTREDVEVIGYGNWEVGIIRLAQEGYNRPAQGVFGWGEDTVFRPELDAFLGDQAD